MTKTVPGTKVYLSLGSNLGDRQHNLATALDQLEIRGVRVLRISSLYETEPQEWGEQPWFLNAVSEVETPLNAFALLDLLQEIEREQGRYRGHGEIPKGPRVIDLDILLFGNAVIDEQGLAIPHPGMLKRRFVLEPLLEIAPIVTSPVTGKALHLYRAGVKDQEVVMVTTTAWWKSKR